MKFTSQHFISPKDCPFTLNGKNLVELRRAKLRTYAKALGVDADGTKNEILGGLIVRLRSAEAESEISEFFKRILEESKKPKKKVAKKAKKKAAKK